MTIILKFNLIILNMLKDYLGTACNRSFPSLPRVLKRSLFKSKPNGWFNFAWSNKIESFTKRCYNEITAWSVSNYITVKLYNCKRCCAGMWYTSAVAEQERLHML